MSMHVHLQWFDLRVLRSGNLVILQVEIGAYRMIGDINVSYMEWSVGLGTCMLFQGA